MRAQASIEFLLITAAYITFILVLIGAQLNYTRKFDTNSIVLSNKAKNFATILSERNINELFPDFVVSGCIELGTDVATCLSGNVSASTKIYYSQRRIDKLA